MAQTDERIRSRIKLEDEAFFQSLEAISEALDGRLIDFSRVHDTSDDTAIDKIVEYFHKTPCTVEGSFKTVDERLDALLRPHGIGYRHVKLTPKWYKECIGPLLGWTDDGKAVALLPDTLGRYHIIDSAGSASAPLNSKTAATLDVEAICFYRPLPQKQLALKDLLLYILRTLSFGDIAFVLLITAAATALGMLLTPINSFIFSEIAGTDEFSLLLPMTCLLVGISLSLSLIKITQGLIFARVNSKMSVPVQAATMMRLLSLPANFFKDFSAGELSSRVQSMNNLCATITSSFFATGISAVFSLVYLYQMFSYASVLILPALFTVFATTACSLVSVVLQMRQLRKKMSLAAKQSGFEYALISGVRKVRLAGAQQRAFVQWAKMYQKVIEITYHPPASITVMTVAPTAASLLGTILIYWLAAINNTSVPDYMAFNVAYGLITGSFLSLTSMVSTFARIQPDMEMIAPILSAIPESAETKESVSFMEGEIRLNNVSFRYSEAMPLVIDELTLKIKPGEYLGIVGTTGCGKSTLIRLILGFEHPQRGAVYYDGKDLEALDLYSLRRSIGVVMQNAQLFQGDIYSNIAISAPWISVDEAWEVAEQVGIADDIRALPMGMHTLISEGGGGISGGQRQRLAIARALASKPSILIFDEATSALDNESQKQITESISALGCTRIVVAHRLSTIHDCDRIIVLDAGHIVEEGSYDDLIAREGLFAKLVERQRI